MSDKKPKNQGEGDKAAARNYDEKTRAFVKKHGEKAAKGPKLSKSEEQAAKRAEQAGRERAREKDPQVTRDYGKPKR